MALEKSQADCMQGTIIKPTSSPSSSLTLSLSCVCACMHNRVYVCRLNAEFGSRLCKIKCPGIAKDTVRRAEALVVFIIYLINTFC